MRGMLDKYRDRSVCVAIDVRYDTPGFSANKATAIFMEYISGDIIHMEIGDSREVGRNSNKLESFIISRGMAYLQTNGLNVVEVVTDASRAIISLFGKSCMHTIIHDFVYKNKHV
ncbi:uncharacterized protein LOC117341413 [Pecten maximus]|uniref:uncharacterized protein LOC117341413 n=1 Tax=Pecten maximus TaxID=6579 RepID=UPI001459185F|nr:uncharacterized protein LOC117341413 [Pecten maximus]